MPLNRIAAAAAAASIRKVHMYRGRDLPRGPGQEARYLGGTRATSRKPSEFSPQRARSTLIAPLAQRAARITECPRTARHAPHRQRRDTLARRTPCERAASHGRPRRCGPLGSGARCWESARDGLRTVRADRLRALTCTRLAKLASHAAVARIFAGVMGWVQTGLTRVRSSFISAGPGTRRRGRATGGHTRRDQ